jgi:hypothetical protein
VALPTNFGDRGGPLRLRPLVALLLFFVVAVPAVTAGLLRVGQVASTAVPQITGSVAAPSASEVSPICDAPDPTSTLGPGPTLPSDPTSRVVTPSGGVSDFAATSTNLYVDTDTQLDTYTLSGSLVHSFALPSKLTGGSAQQVSQPVVDPSGNIYLASYSGQTVAKFSPTGSELWAVDPSKGLPTGLFSIGSGGNFELAVTLEGQATSQLLDLSTGATSGTFPWADNGEYVTPEADGDLLVSGTGYVQTISPSGSVVSSFGSSHTAGADTHTGSGTQFYLPGQAVQGPDGTIYTADLTDTIEATSATGAFEASTTLGTDSAGGGNLSLGGGNMYLVGGTLYFQSGTAYNAGADSISSVPLSTLTAYLAAVQPPTDSLGWGAGLSSTATGNYFGPGTSPSIAANFDPLWAASASHLQLSYSVENTASLTAETVPTPTAIALPTSAKALASIPLTIPAADQVPGPYLVQASLFDTSTSPATRVGTTCLPYTVGTAGDTLNLGTLPAGVNAGGADPERAVALNAELGLNGERTQSFSWSDFLPNCNASAPTAATCGPSAMTFTAAPMEYFEAAKEALTDHTRFWVQIGGGDSVSPVLVSNGWWQGDIRSLVTYYSQVPPGCTSCAPVTTWEPWNESNNTGWGNAAAYVTQVLAPFYQAVKAVEPGTASTVVGGSTLAPSPSWWQQLVAAGGLNSMDVAAIHPYDGNNDSFEEDGMPAQVQQVQALLAGKPLWFTEVGWWSDGDYNYLGQADSVARALVWMKALNIPVWNYFFDEGSWGNDGISFSLIQTKDGDDYVKPAALASMESSNQLAARPFLSMPATGIPQTYEASFGAASGESTQLDALWSDGLATNGAVTVASPGGGSIPVTVTSEYGNTTSVSVTSGTTYRLPISNQVTYVSIPVGDTLTVAPPQPYGDNLALASAGATATASSGNASAAIAGLTVGEGNGWSSTSGDSTPSLTVSLPGTPSVNRVVLDTQSVGSTATGVRNYTVSVDEPDSGWTTVATVVGQYRNHEMEFDFDPVMASAVRINVTEINFGGYYGGGIPPFWSPTNAGTAFVHALQVYGGDGTPDEVAGTALPLLVPAGASPPPPTTTTTTTTTSTTAAKPPPTTTTSTTAAKPPPTTTTTTTTTTTAPPPTTSTTTTAPPPTTSTTTTTTSSPPTSTTTTTTAAPPPTTTTLTTSPPPTTTTTTTNPPPTTTTTTAPPTTTTTTSPTPPPAWPIWPIWPVWGWGSGYWMATSGGGVFTFGTASFFGPGLVPFALPAPIVGTASLPGDDGYWLVGADGGVFSFGAAGFYGSLGGVPLQAPIVGVAATPDGQGYWLVDADGGVFPFGDAQYFGSAGFLTLDQPIVGMAATPDGQGYWLVAKDGGIFAFGDADYFGSTGSLTLNQPIVGMAATPDGQGYWLVASDGGVFACGDAGFFGSTGSLALNRPIVGIASSPDGHGYWMVAGDGGIFAFGDAGFRGSTGGTPLTHPVVGISS